MGDVGKVWGADLGVGVYCYRGGNLDSAAAPPSWEELSAVRERGSICTSRGRAQSDFRTRPRDKGWVTDGSCARNHMHASE